MSIPTFTAATIAELRLLLREKSRPSTGQDRQKQLRARMRRLGFRISDFTYDAEGFVESDLDELIARGRIRVTS